MRIVAIAVGTVLLGCCNANGDVRTIEGHETLSRALIAESRRAPADAVDVEGVVEVVVVEDFDAGASSVLYFVNAAQERWQLHFAGKPPPGLLTGKRIRAKGVALGDHIVIEDATEDFEVQGAVGPEAATIQTLSNTIGGQRTAVVAVNFADNLVEPWTMAEINQAVFGDTSNFMYENSYGRTTVTGDAFGWLTLPINSDPCDAFSIQREADALLAAAGIDLSTYARKIYVFPRSPCGFDGRALLGGPVAWLNGFIDTYYVAHEYGHMFGLYHSRSLDCDAATIAPIPQCTINTYGDGLDTMGRDQPGHYNAFQKQRLEWMTDVIDVTASSIIELGIYETPAVNHPRAARVLRTDDGAGHRTWYYLEVRRAIGFDAWIPDTPWRLMVDGVVLRVGTDDEPDSSYLLDATPQSQAFDRHDGRIPVGTVYEDVEAGVSIAVDALDDAAATVTVSYFAPQNQPPVAASDAVSTPRRTSVIVDVLANDSDPEGSPLHVTGVTPPNGGAASVQSNESILYKPRNNFVGVDTFSYTISDGVNEAVGAVTVTVVGK